MSTTEGLKRGYEVLDTGVTGRTYHAVAHLNLTGVHGRSDVDDDADTLDGPVQVSRIELLFGREGFDLAFVLADGLSAATVAATLREAAEGS